MPERQHLSVNDIATSPRGFGQPVTRGNPPPIRAVVSDLDGTLLRSDGTLSESTIQVLAAVRDLGIPFVVATARTPRAVRKVPGHEYLGRMVCANGAIVWDATRDETVSETWFEPRGLAAAVAQLGRSVPEAGVALLSAQRMFLDDASLALRGKGAAGADVFPAVDGVLSGHRIVMVAVRHPTRTVDRFLAAVTEAFAGVGTASFAGLDTVDVAPDTTTKLTATATELAAAGCPPGATVAFGDMPNDLPLLAWSGWACAVANAHPSVLAAADEVVPGNDDDGVARTVSRLLRC